MVGTYEACFNEVLDGEADITASYAGRRGAGYIERCGNSAHPFRTLAYSDECPNDAVVMAPQLDAARKTDIEANFRKLIHTPRAPEILAAMFDVDGFDQPPAGSTGSWSA